MQAEEGEAQKEGGCIGCIQQHPPQAISFRFQGLQRGPLGAAEAGEGALRTALPQGREEGEAKGMIRLTLPLACNSILIWKQSPSDIKSCKINTKELSCVHETPQRLVSDKSTQL